MLAYKYYFTGKQNISKYRTQGKVKSLMEDLKVEKEKEKKEG